ncbi:hypothetical protein RUA4292_03252 [Ruegeria atlantica]|uniref:Uncharacterized protein n=1 Tax=Ruegeria atlantica TaxID=81569 RepID=A0A0P1EGS4_9RHOB|nr:hypothetical protein RUA4292_03252 [Ruegeria atlantica]
MGILVLAVVTGFIGAAIALISGYGVFTVIGVYCLIGLASILLISLPAIWLCSLRKRWSQNTYGELNSEV